VAALESPVPAPRKVPERASPARDAVAPLADAMLAEDLGAPRKQRRTARRVWVRLRDEHDAEVSYSYVAQYVARRRPEIEAGARGQAESLEGFVPQAKEPGTEAEVDFGAVTVVLDGREAGCHLFAYRLSFSGRAVHRVYASCAQEALLEGHVTRMIGKAVRVRLTANELTVFDGSKAVAVHPRLVASGDEHLVLDHYLEILARKPGALPGSVPLAQARRDGSFTATHEALWAEARRRLGDGARDAVADRGAAAAPAAAGRVGGRRDRGRPAGRDVLPGRGGGRGPQARRCGRPGGSATGADPPAVAGGGHHAAAPGRAAAGRRPAAPGCVRL
jgi:hypothetical protein